MAVTVFNPPNTGLGWWSTFHSSLLRSIAAVDRSSTLTLAASATIRPEHSTVLVNSTSGSVTVTLPPASDCTGREYRFKKLVAANTMTLDADGSETIDGSATAATATQYGSFTLVSDGSNWHVF